MRHNSWLQRAALCVLMSVAAVSCADRRAEQEPEQEQEPAPPIQPDTRLHTDSSAYTLVRDRDGWTTTIGFTYHNTGADTVFVMNCNQHVVMNLQKYEAGEWRNFWHGPTNACLSPPIIIPPATEYHGELQVWGADPGTSNSTEFTSLAADGTYRLLWHQPLLHYTGMDAPLGDPLPEIHRISNPFTLRLQSGRAP